MFKNGVGLCILGCLALALTACNTAVTITAPEAIPTTSPASSSPTVQAAATLSATLTATLRPSPTATPTKPAPTQVAQIWPEPSATPVPRPLDASGPWLLGDEFVVSNLDGSGRVSLPVSTSELATPVQFWRPKIAIGQQGYLAVVSLEGGLDFELLIFKLPQTEPVRRIALLSEAARQAAEVHTESGENGCLAQTSAVLASLIWSIPQWSPDGRYLAFVGALDGPNTDVYVYDTQKNVVRRLTSGSDQASLVDWSPDSQWIIHHSDKNYCWDGPFWADGLTAWAVSVQNGRVIHLHETSGAERFGGWASATTFFVLDLYFESAPLNLRRVDIASGRTETVWEGGFYDLAINPASGEAMVSFAPRIMLGLGHPEQNGIYRLRPGSTQLELILSGEYDNLEWLPEVGLFAASPGETSIGHSPPTTLLFDVEGEILGQLTGGDLLPSPDGQWVLTRLENGPLVLSTIQGEVVREFATLNWRTNAFTWLPDSSGFYTCAYYLVWHIQAEGWEERLEPASPEYCARPQIPARPPTR